MRKRKRPQNQDDDDDDEASNDDIVKLVTKNHILFFACVSPKTICLLHEILIKLQCNARPVKNIYLHIHSPGGDATAGLAGFDLISNSSIPITTIVVGESFSAASLMSMAGKERYILPNAFIMLHDITTTMMGKYQDAQVDLQNTRFIRDKYVQLYKKHSNLNMPKLREEFASDLYMNAQDAVKNGLADKVGWPQALS